MRNDCFTTKSPRKSREIQLFIKGVKKLFRAYSLTQLMLLNPLEKLVPMNLWFHHPEYQVIDNFEQQQHLRLRQYADTLLTPLVARSNTNLPQFQSCLEHLSLYQPFYPETFYGTWEFLKLRHLRDDIKNFLYIGREEGTGSMEAIIYYHERYLQSYRDNKYHLCLIGNESYQIVNDEYFFNLPNVNYLDQAYHVRYLESSKELTNVRYGLVSIDTIHLFDDISKWSKEEEDFQALLFYFLLSLESLDTKGAMIIKLNFFISPSWYLLFDLVFYYFEEYTFYRPSTSHPLNPEVYLYLDKLATELEPDAFRYFFVKNLYKQKVYQHFHLNLNEKKLGKFLDNPNTVLRKYLEARDSWLKTAMRLLKSPRFVKNWEKNLDKWHGKHDLDQLKDIVMIGKTSENSKSSDDSKLSQLNSLLLSNLEFRAYPLKKPSLRLNAKNIRANRLLVSEENYLYLCKKRAQLNCHKRVMDTKPNCAFSNSHCPKDSQFIFWEELTSQIDPLKYVKVALKELNVEMPTNAWMKMYEMLTYYPQLLNSKKIKSLHICEAPGSFISALHHYLSNKDIEEWIWYAQTLRPTHTGERTDAALQDHFGLISSYPQRWIFGDPVKDNSGDITHSAIIKYMSTHPELQEINFMTADAGLPCHPREFNEQELYLSKISIGQVTCILACLSKGGSAIIKFFLPMCEPMTISLTNLITSLFESVEIVKPRASHQHNSEVYLVAQNYRGISPGILDFLYAMLDQPTIDSSLVLFRDFDADFYYSYVSAVSNLIDNQISSLSHCYYYYYHWDEIKQVDNYQRQQSEKWLKDHCIPTLAKKLL